MPVAAPAITKSDFLAKLADFLASKPDFVEENDISLGTEEDIINGAEYAVMNMEEIFEDACKDWSEVQFYAENVVFREELPATAGTGLHGVITRPSGLSFLVGLSGGDWEFPVLIVLYHDGNTFRGYVPTRGNSFNKDTRQAWGNDEDDDIIALMKEFPNHPFVTSRSEDQLREDFHGDFENPANSIDAGEILADIDAHIQVQ